METTELMNRKIEQGREYRQMTMEIRTLEDGKEDYIVEGYATTFNQPYHLYNTYNNVGALVEVKEQVDRSAFDNTDMRDVIMQYDHVGRVFARITNDTLKLTTNEHGLLIRAYLGGTEIGRNLYEEIKGGYTNKMSFGFTVAENGAEIKADGDGYLRTINSISKLFDVSAVSLPANDYTEISARKSCDGVIAEIETERANLEEKRRVKAERMEKLQERLKGLRKD